MSPSRSDESATKKAETKSSVLDRLELADDKSNAVIGPVHYFAVYLWCGWIVTFIALSVILPICYMRNKYLFAILMAIIVYISIVPINRNTEPQWGYQLGSWIMHKAAEYFGIKMYFEDKKAVCATAPAIFMLEPHDVLPLSIFAFSDFMGYIPGHKLLGCVTSACFKVPFMRHVYTWCNGTTVSKKNLQNWLRNGTSLTVCPGGANEALYLNNKEECVLYIKNRLGLIKLAMEFGVPVIPSFTFGLRNTFSCWVPEGPLTKKMGKMLGFVPIFFSGVLGIPFSQPKPCQLTVVIGKPIAIPKIDKPSEEEIRKYHTIVLDAMAKIYNDYKDEFGMGHIRLRIE